MMRSPRFLSVILIVCLLLGSGFSVFAQETGSSYTVQYGDVLDIIASSLDVSVDCIAEASNITNPNRLRPGDTLVIPADCPPYAGVSAVSVSTTSSAQSEGQGGGSASGDSYIVQRGDLLDSIAARFDVSVTCLAEANQLSNPRRIFPGDSLVIDLSCPLYTGSAPVLNPRNPEDLGQGGGGAAGDRQYQVQRGDTLDGISARYDVDVACTAEASGITNAARIKIGDTVIIDFSCPRYSGFAVVTNPRDGSVVAPPPIVTPEPTPEPETAPADADDAEEATDESAG